MPGGNFAMVLNIIFLELRRTLAITTVFITEDFAVKSNLLL